MQFEVVQRDVTEQRADALLNAANTDLRMGGGVAGALRKAAGEAIQREATERAPIGLGEADETGVYDLDEITGESFWETPWWHGWQDDGIQQQVREWTEQAAGSEYVDSEPGEGSTFSFTLPAVDADSE